MKKFLSVVHDAITVKLPVIRAFLAEFVIIFGQCNWELDWFDQNVVFVSL